MQEKFKKIILDLYYFKECQEKQCLLTRFICSKDLDILNFHLKILKEKNINEEDLVLLDNSFFKKEFEFLDNFLNSKKLQPKSNYELLIYKLLSEDSFFNNLRKESLGFDLDIDIETKRLFEEILLKARHGF